MGGGAGGGGGGGGAAAERAQRTATISPTTFFSFSRTASSTAISQKGFMPILTFAMSTAVLAAFKRIFTA